jgi:predicted amidophosphoribosyltransferase
MVGCANSPIKKAEKIARAFIAASQGETAGAKQLKLALIFNRIKEVSPQVKTKNRKERFVNMENSFAVKQVVEIKNALVIVVDDIVTTGATLSAAATALYNAGAGKVVGLTIAHTLEKQQISDKLGQV